MGEMLFCFWKQQRVKSELIMSLKQKESMAWWVYCKPPSLISDDNQKILVMKGTFLCVLVLVNVIPNLQKRCTSLWDQYQGKTLCHWLSINWPSSRYWHTKVLDTWKVTQLKSLCQKSVKTSLWGFDGHTCLVTSLSDVCCEFTCSHCGLISWTLQAIALYWTAAQ